MVLPRSFHNASEGLRMLETASDCIRKLQNASEGFRMHEKRRSYGGRWSSLHPFLFDRVLTILSSSSCSSIVIGFAQIASESFRMHPKASECIRSAFPKKGGGHPFLFKRVVNILSLLSCNSMVIVFAQTGSDCIIKLQNASEGFRMYQKRIS